MFEVDCDGEAGRRSGAMSKSASTRSSPSSSPTARPRTKSSARRRARSRGRIRGLEQVGGFGGKAVALAEGQVFAGDSNFYKRSLIQYAAVTPANVRSAMQQWLTLPAFTVRLEPGERPPYVEAKGAPPEAEQGHRYPQGQAGGSADRQPVPLDFPAISPCPAVERDQGCLRPAHRRSGDAAGAVVRRRLCSGLARHARPSEHDAEPARRGCRRPDLPANRRRRRRGSAR